MDVRGLLTYKLFFYWCNISAIICTMYSKLICLLKDVRIGKYNKFYGLPLIVRHPYSTISIANNCRFRSDSSSNLIGVNRKCIISTNSPNARVSIGNNCGFSGTSIGCLVEIIIDDNVLLGANTLITDFDWHNLDPSKRSLPVQKGSPIRIEENVFIGYGATILKGVNIGKNSVIGAHSVVTSNIPANCIAAGNPCKVIKYFYEELQD